MKVYKFNKISLKQIFLFYYKLITKSLLKDKSILVFLLVKNKIFIKCLKIRFFWRVKD